MTAAHTPGPWRWELNEKSKWVELLGHAGAVVMDFRRWGMAGATPRFEDGSKRLLVPAQTFGVVVPGREHHAEWFKRLDHPDVNLIAAAPDLLAAVQRSLAWCTAAGMDGSGDCVEPEWCEQARAAIAKLRGGA